MEKNNKRVSKRLVTIAIFLILLATLITKTENDVVEAPDNDVKVPFNVVEINKKMMELARPVEIVKSKPTEVQKAVKVAPKVAAKVKPIASQTKEVKKEVVEESPSEWMNFTMTHYVANCEGCSGFTYTEYDVRNTIYYEGYRVLSVDPNVIKEGSVVEIVYGDTKFEAIAIDRGGAIKGRKLDLLVKGLKEAYREGKKSVKLRVVREGW